MARVLLSKQIQKQLCLTAKEQSKSSWTSLAKELAVSPRAFENWYRAERFLPEPVFRKLHQISKLSIQNIRLLPDNWGRIKGGQNSIALHGKSFWTLEGSKKGGANSARKFPSPSYSDDLAEFVGVMLGDGGISRGQISITLGYNTDQEYVPYLTNLIRKLFKTEPSVSKPFNQNVYKIRVSGVNLIKYLLGLGLIQGNKVNQQFDIPAWISQKDEYIKACIRGLIDTDGCVHRKVRRGKNGIEYRSIGITFSSYSKPLQRSLIKFFDKLHLKASISGVNMYLCGKENVTRYLEEIGFSNPKHWNRYQKFLSEYGWKKISTTKNCL